MGQGKLGKHHGKHSLFVLLNSVNHYAQNKVTINATELTRHRFSDAHIGQVSPTLVKNSRVITVQHKNCAVARATLSVGGPFPQIQITLLTALSYREIPISEAQQRLAVTSSAAAA